MSLNEQQIVDKNRIGRLGALLIIGSLLLMTLLTFLQGVTPQALIRIILCIVLMIVNIVGYRVLKKSPKYVHVCCSSMIVLFLTVLITVSNGYTYAYVYPIAMLVVLFTNRRLTRIGCSLAIAGIMIYFIVRGVLGMAVAEEVILCSMLVIIDCVIAMLTTSMQIQHSDQNMKAVQNGADAQAKIAGDIVGLADQLNSKFVQANEVSGTLNESMETSHLAVSEIAESTRINAEAIEQQTNQTSDIQDSIQNVGREAKEMGAISERTNSTVNEGVRLIGRLKEQAAEVAKINHEARITTQQLNESIKDVEAITETILGISSQTNLLALNASIEAARAGEAGKGFAVVADEIRNLSEDTRKATEQISEIISKLTKDAETAASSMMQSAEYADRQNELIDETGKKLTDIKSDTDILYNNVKEVNGSVESIIAANTMIMESITNLSATGQEVAASTDTALSLSESTMDALQNMNNLLQEINSISNEMEEVAGHGTN